MLVLEPDCCLPPKVIISYSQSVFTFLTFPMEILFPKDIQESQSIMCLQFVAMSSNSRCCTKQWSLKRLSQNYFNTCQRQTGLQSPDHARSSLANEVQTTFHKLHHQRSWANRSMQNIIPRNHSQHRWQRMQTIDK